MQHFDATYRTIVDQVPIALLILQDEQVVFANAASEALTSYSFDTISREGHVFTDFVVPEERDRLRACYHQRLQGEVLPPYLVSTDFLLYRKIRV